VIWGRSSCAYPEVKEKEIPSSATKNDRRYKIFRNAILPKAVLPGEIPMKVNDKAPDFTLQDENGKEVTLKDLHGKTVVLYFYPRADTPG
jgi:hypothetical protein